MSAICDSHSNLSPLPPPLAADASHHNLLRSPMDPAHPPPHYRVPLSVPLAIFWDIENCRIPGDVYPEDVAGNIRMALRVHPAVKGSVVIFSAYGDFNHFPRKLREGCQRTGVNLVDVPNVRKAASDKAVLIDMFLFALDNPPPCTVLLISGDVDFAPALHKLGQRGYTMLLAVPSGVAVSPALCNAGRSVWHWPSLARGDGLVPAKQFLHCLGEGRRATESSAATVDDAENEYLCHQHVNTRHVFEHSNVKFGRSVTSESTMKQASGETWIMDHHVIPCGQPCIPIQANLAHVHGSTISTNLQSNGSPNLSSASNSIDGNDGRGSTESVELWIQPGDLKGLKLQLIQLLKSNNGRLPLFPVPSLYCKRFGRPLHLSDYGSPKLVRLIERMPDAFFITGQGNNKDLCLKDMMEAQSIADAMHNQNSSDEDLIEDFVSMQKNAQTCADKKASKPEEDEEQIRLQPAAGEMSDGESDLAISLEVLKLELEELLVSHACMIPFSRLPVLYKQRYAHELDPTSFGFEHLEFLLHSMHDVIAVKTDSVTSKKFVVAKRNM